ncbi:TspO/MBR family protein [Mucilaginibacter paludis]|uniref:TspO and MBR like protein n=1 Tax=Mucilaginibacter paludis DSM 18603 TaxID=714943 RepID=H1Y5C9_9SPHI|nr:TspO/MBR family protein [Mucilaginibacter paludis]EHQ28940.1 TspO and MBR like protein [Mucilaginibacter paludis DSM 18603]
MAAYIQPQRFKFLPFIISILITLSIGGVASFFTLPQIKGWYVYLHKPSFNPPNWLFGPVWTLLYIMMGVAAYLIWQQRARRVKYGQARNIYLLQLLFNFSWSIVFFGMHQILAALVVIVLLWVSIVVNIVLFGRINKTAAWLLVPYLLWVSFASVLNFAIYILNK